MDWSVEKECILASSAPFTARLGAILSDARSAGRFKASASAAAGEESRLVSSRFELLQKVYLINTCTPERWDEKEAKEKRQKRHPQRHEDLRWRGGTHPLISKSNAITSDDGTGMVLCSTAKPSACCVAMTAMYHRGGLSYRGSGEGEARTDRGARRGGNGLNRSAAGDGAASDGEYLAMVDARVVGDGGGVVGRRGEEGGLCGDGRWRW